jgi:putative nucleotidyltransferase with HDIG domain
MLVLGIWNFQSDITAMTPQQAKYGVNEIAELFPPLMKISDQSLREKVAAVWNEAIATGCGGKGWTFDELRAVKFTLLAGDIDMTFVEHLNSCALQCIAIADVLEKSFRCGIPVNRDYLIAGALLADVGKPLEYDKDASGKVVQGTFGQQLRHPFSGVALAYKHGVPGEVMHIIATHSHEGDKVERSIESIIFHHADFVDFDIAKLLGKRAGKK